MGGALKNPRVDTLGLPLYAADDAPHFAQIEGSGRRWLIDLNAVLCPREYGTVDSLHGDAAGGCDLFNRRLLAS
jgi:hypothetical protein